MRVFIVGAGRSGTLSASVVLGMNTETEHEYECTRIERLGTMLHYGLLQEYEVAEELRAIFDKEIVHVNNKLSWVLPELVSVFRDARFVFLARDGRKVVSSYYNKLSDEAYTPEGIMAQNELLRSGNEPELRKGLWYPLPYGGFHGDINEHSRFRLISWYWGKTIDSIYSGLRMVGDVDFRAYRLEDVVSDNVILDDFVEYCTGGKPSVDAYSFMSRAHNVIEPKNYVMTHDQRLSFWRTRLAAKWMDTLGYSEEDEYEVEY